MHNDLIECGWTEEHWSRICSTVSEEAQKARVAAQILPVSGPEHPSAVAIPHYGLSDEPATYPPPRQRLAVDSDPTLFITTIAINVELRTVEMAEPEQKAALAKFRRAANYIARIEDAVIFNGRAANPTPVSGIPDVYQVTGDRTAPGIFAPRGMVPNNRISQALPPFVPAAGSPNTLGMRLVSAIARRIGQLESRGQLGPYACVLGQDYFAEVCDPTANLVLPRDRILPFLQGPLVRSSSIPRDRGAVIALSGNPVEIVVASELGVRYLQTSPEPRCIFRVSERIALRIQESSAIALLANI